MWTQADLEQLDWREIKEIAESFAITKPEGGWLDAIPLILIAQSSNTNEVIVEPKAEITEMPIFQSERPAVIESKTEDQNAKFSTKFYAGAKIDYCPTCGEKKRIHYGQAICPTGNKDCPMTKK